MSNARKRLSLDLYPEAKETFETIQKKSQSGSLTETIRKAMAYYELLLDHKAKKGTVILVDVNGAQSPPIPIL